MPFDGKPELFTKTNVADVLRRAKALIDTPEKWCKEKRDNGRGAHCVLGAIDAAVGHGTFDDSVTEPYWLALFGAIGSPSGHRDASWAVAAWNNKPDTTHADMMAAFDKAIALAEQSEGGS